jgi:hypothetical protein
MATVDQYFNEQSWQLLFRSDVFGTYDNLPCTGVYINDVAMTRQAAADAGVDLTPYGNNVFYSWVGGPAGDKSIYPPWYFAAHEIAHRVFSYFNHENGVVCDYVSGVCADSERGNLFSVLGNGQGHFSAWLKYLRGWAPIITVSTSGDYVIEPLETAPAGGVKGLRFLLGKRTQFPWILEYRQPIGFDSGPLYTYDPQNAFNGVLLYSLLNGTDLQQVLPYTAGTLQQIAVPVGGTVVCNSDTRLKVTVVSVTPAGATVRFKYGSKC